MPRIHDTRGAKPLNILLLLNSGGDFDALAPLVKEGVQQGGTSFHAVLTSRYRKLDPKAESRLAELGCLVSKIPTRAAGWLGWYLFRGVDALITATESSLKVHRDAYNFTLNANRWQIRTYTLQQGLENVGLTYFDDHHGPDVSFAAKRVLTWGPVENLPRACSTQTRGKATAVGSSKLFISSERRGPNDRPLAAIFENLHWHRYPDTYRRDFYEALSETAVALPSWDFVLKPHPKSKVSAPFFTQAFPSNINVASDPSREIGPTIAAMANRVITTPSTIALDAAMAGTSVAIAAFGLSVDYYRPLPALGSAEDWIAFVSGGEQPQTVREAFASRVLVKGAGAPRILALLRAEAGADKGRDTSAGVDTYKRRSSETATEEGANS